MNRHTKALLFDFDGVVVDTESQYDRFWNAIGMTYDIPDPHFSATIKGATLNSILSNHLSHLSQQQHQQIRMACSSFEQKMQYTPIKGALEFIRKAREQGFLTALVTSSDDKKVAAAFQHLPLEGLFDSIVTADKITRGKPDPMCFLLAATELGVRPAQCIVFEDSFAGIRSGIDASMRVIALATTNKREKLQVYVDEIIDDFSSLTPEAIEHKIGVF